MMTVAELDEKFGLSGLSFKSGQGGLIKATVDNHLCQGEIYLHGAHVTHYQPSDQKPVLWVSDRSMFDSGKPIRGGVPICFPWFGPLATDPKAPGHGYARTKLWDFVAANKADDGSISVVLKTVIDSFEVTYQVTFGDELTMMLSVALAPDAMGPREFEAALHTYFAISDIRLIEIEGLESNEFIDKVDGAKRKAAELATVRFSGECDRVYLDSTGTCELRDPGFHRLITVAKLNSSSTVVWNPWIDKSAKMADFGDDEWQGMACIETANVGPSAIRLRPGESHAMTARVSSTLI